MNQYGLITLANYEIFHLQYIPISADSLLVGEMFISERKCPLRICAYNFSIFRRPKTYQSARRRQGRQVLKIARSWQPWSSSVSISMVQSALGVSVHLFCSLYSIICINRLIEVPLDRLLECFFFRIIYVILKNNLQQQYFCNCKNGRGIVSTTSNSKILSSGVFDKYSNTFFFLFCLQSSQARGNDQFHLTSPMSWWTLPYRWSLGWKRRNYIA